MLSEIINRAADGWECHIDGDKKCITFTKKNRNVIVFWKGLV